MCTCVGCHELVQTQQNVKLEVAHDMKQMHTRSTQLTQVVGGRHVIGGVQRDVFGWIERVL